MSIAPSRIEAVDGADGRPTCIGRGGFGAVFLARLRSPGASGEVVAVKRVQDLTDPRAAAQQQRSFGLSTRSSCGSRCGSTASAASTACARATPASTPAS